MITWQIVVSLDSDGVVDPLVDGDRDLVDGGGQEGEDGQGPEQALKPRPNNITWL